jgi:lipoyl(octanoyl) transferase
MDSALTLHLLPDRVAGAAENMAVDFLLLQRYPQPAAVRFRHYGWRGPAVTFGYSQKAAWVRERLEAAEGLELVRRVSGGGIVDHRADWTYALVLPRGHPAEELRAAESYRLVHEALAAALVDQGVPAVLKPCEVESSTCAAEARASRTRGAKDTAEPGPGVCFQRAEVFDVVLQPTGEKIAGAAQKRNKHGLLLQGSVARAAVVGLDWEVFRESFVTGLGAGLEVAVVPTAWPEFSDDELEGLTEQYGSPEWMNYR